MIRRSLLWITAVFFGCTHQVPATTASVITLAFSGVPADTMRVLVTNASAIRDAQQYVNTGKGPRMATGLIERGRGIDSAFPFHFVPEDVHFVQLSMEGCDGRPMRTTAEVDRFFAATGHGSDRRTRWCPWNSYPIAVDAVKLPTNSSQ